MITIQRYQTSQRQNWNKLILLGNNGTLFHQREFLGYHAPGKIQDYSLLFFKKEIPFVPFPAAEKTINGDKWLVSHPGASMGSFVVPEDLSVADSFLLVETLIDFAKNNQFKGIKITLPPIVYQKRPSNYMDFALLKSGFNYAKREVSSLLFLENSIDKNLKKFKDTHRRAVKKALKMGVEVRQTEDFDSFYDILKQNLKIRHGVTPTHTLDELKYLHELFPTQIHLIAAYVNQTMIAGVVNFVINDRVVLAFYISHNEQFQEYRAVNLLFYKTFEWAIEEKYLIFDFGIFTVNEVPNMGLGRFKENFGSSGIFRDTLEISFD